MKLELIEIGEIGVNLVLQYMYMPTHGILQLKSVSALKLLYYITEYKFHDWLSMVVGCKKCHKRLSDVIILNQFYAILDVSRLY